MEDFNVTENLNGTICISTVGFKRLYSGYTVKQAIRLFKKAYKAYQSIQDTNIIS